MVDDPAALGRRVARRFLDPEGRPEPREIAVGLGVEVVIAEAPPPAQPRLRSEYRPDPPRIILYRDPLSDLAACIHANQRFDMLACDLEQVHIAHELFHHLEAGGRFGTLPPREAEEAAHAFAAALLDLKFHPAELSELLREPEESG